MNKTKIICTIGPASLDMNTIKGMYKSGMDGCRINMSHGDFKQYDTIIKNVRKACNCPIMMDTAGPELRIDNNNSIFKKDEKVLIKFNADVYKDLKKGMTVKLNDGLNSGVIEEVNKDSILLKMASDGEIVKNRSVSIKDFTPDLPPLTEKDKKGIIYAKKKRVEFISLSFTNNAEQIKNVKLMLKGSDIRVIAKIESKEGIKNIDSIIETADAVMIARGDMGVEIGSEKVPIIQKEIIKKCNLIGKPVIVATQIMESMILNKSPTRAETSDVANAVFDGTDALLLSGETSIGSNPTLVVKTVNDICRSIESHKPETELYTKESSVEDAITKSAFHIADSLNAHILCLTRSGYTARMLSRYKSRKIVIAATSSDTVYRQLMISYGVMPLIVKVFKDNDKIVKTTKIALEKGLIKKEDKVVFVSGLYLKNTTNNIIVFNVGELLR